MRRALVLAGAGAVAAAVGALGDLFLTLRLMAYGAADTRMEVYVFESVLDLVALVACAWALLGARRASAWPLVGAALAVLVAGILLVASFAQPFYLVAAALFVWAARSAPAFSGPPRVAAMVAGALAGVLGAAIAIGWMAGAAYCEGCHWFPWAPWRNLLTVLPFAGVAAAAWWPRPRAVT